MPRKPYEYANGVPVIQQHSIAKHKVLQTYLAAYLQTLVSSPNQEILRVTFVDGFAGGGQYIHENTKEIVNGSPLIFLQSVKEAEFMLNQNRIKPLILDANYIFVESDRDACSQLSTVLNKEGYGAQIGNAIQVLHSKFQDEADNIIKFIKRRSPQNGRSIFFLDQYGYMEVSAQLIQRILSQLPRAEIILTFAMDSLLNYVNDIGMRRTNENLGIPDFLQGRSLEDIKKLKNWRYFIQSRFYKNMMECCGAEYYTPFFIRNKQGHGDYWLIHLSQHYRARDVMTKVHWNNNNYFIHYGGPGLDMFQMLGYDPDHDPVFRGQSALGFEFDDVAKKASITALNEDIPQRIFAHDSGLSFGELYATTCNGSPASEAVYKDSIGELIEHKIVEVISTENVQRRSARQIKFTDQIKPARQGSLFFP